jgi:outer membrane protein assembly factor BamA
MAPFLRLLRAAGVALICCLAASELLAQRDDSDERISPEVRAVRIQGNDNLAAGRIRNSVATRASRCRSVVLQPFCWIAPGADLLMQRRYLDRNELARDVLRIRILYWREGYREASVDTVVAAAGPGRVEVSFRVTEGPPTLVSSLSVLHPPEAITQREIESSLRLRAGDPLSLTAIDSSIANIREVLLERGYADAIIRDTVEGDPARRTGAVRIEIEPRWIATVGEIRVFGLNEISEQTVRNLLALGEGDVFRRSELIRSQQNLYVSNLFRQAEIRLPTFPDSVKALDILVEEAQHRDVRASAGFNTMEFFQLEGRFTHYHAFGGPRRVDLRGAVGNLFAGQLEGRGIFRELTANDLITGDPGIFLRPNWQAAADLVQPWFLGPRNTLGTGVFAHRRAAPGIFVDLGFGAQTSFTREVARRMQVSAVYRFEVTEVQAGDLYFCVNYGVCELPVIDALRARNRLSPFALTLRTERSDDPIDPTRGYRMRVDLEHASAATISDYRYNRAVLEMSRYFPGWRNSTLAGRVRVGLVGATSSPVADLPDFGLAGARLLHPRKRFYAGGARSVRGYPEDQLGPSILTVAPEALIEAGCTAAQLAAGQCPNLAAVPAAEFQPRPIGATSVLEGSVEWRLPVWGPLSAAFFVDGAILGERGFGLTEDVTAAVTPGFGARYNSPVGPIRLDLGIRPVLAERLSVVTQVTDADGNPRLVQLEQQKDWDPLENISGARRILQRMTLHLSIGQAF